MQKCIKAANDMLLTIGTRPDPTLTRRLQLHFLSLRGTLVKVAVECDNSTLEIIGKLETAGKNFIQLNMVDSKAIILFERICSIAYEKEESGGQAHLTELIEIDTCTRRNLVLHFGAFASRRPNIVNQMIGISLYLQLIEFLGCQVSIKTDGEAITVKTENELKRINFNEICLNHVKSTHH